jgi:hypothetical protein
MDIKSNVFIFTLGTILTPPLFVMGAIGTVVNGTKYGYKITQCFINTMKRMKINPERKIEDYMKKEKKFTTREDLKWFEYEVKRIKYRDSAKELRSLTALFAKAMIPIFGFNLALNQLDNSGECYEDRELKQYEIRDIDYAEYHLKQLRKKWNIQDDNANYRRGALYLENWIQ